MIFQKTSDSTYIPGFAYGAKFRAAAAGTDWRSS